MEVWSFAEVGCQLSPVRVEVNLIPGLPEFVVTGLPDQGIKESVIRIKSALRAQGFQLPKAEKVLINLSPANEKKSSRGLELAIAMAYLWETSQLPKVEDKKVYVYGELGLKGEVQFLEELNWAPLSDKDVVWAGYPKDTAADLEIKAISHLSMAGRAETLLPSESHDLCERPPFDSTLWEKGTADLLAVLAHGGHHALLAGPAGSGKSTLARGLYQVLPDPKPEELKNLRRWNRYFKRSLQFRPLENPHHSSTPQALLGGGNPPGPGIITRAHRGLLLLDEFLEYPPKVREGLREALETGEITLARRGYVEKLPAEFQLVATTNLCPCGDYNPKAMNMKNCRFTLGKCQSYQQRLSGPILDRFDVLSLSHSWGKKGSVPLGDIYERVQRAQIFQDHRQQEKPNGRLQWDELLPLLKSQHLLQYLPETLKSRRRTLAVLRVARSLADLDAKEKIQLEHIRGALPATNTSFF